MDVRVQVPPEVYMGVLAAERISGCCPQSRLPRSPDSGPVFVEILLLGLSLEVSPLVGISEYCRPLCPLMDDAA